MTQSVRIPLTADQKALIEEAARLEGVDMTAWVRPLLIAAARDQIARHRKGKGRQK